MWVKLLYIYLHGRIYICPSVRNAESDTCARRFRVEGKSTPYSPLSWPARGGSSGKG